MKKNKAISLLLSMSLLSSLAMPSTFIMPTYAAGTPEGNEGMVLHKKAEKKENEEDKYTITLEAYATGEQITTEVKKDIPTDIVLVLDQSGSMVENKMSTYAFQAYTGKTNENYYGLRYGQQNFNLYYPCEDGGYAPVSVERIPGEVIYTYVECGKNWNNEDYFYNQPLFVKNGENYEKVNVSKNDDWIKPTFTYAFPNDFVISSSGYYIKPKFGNNGPLFYRTETREYSYTYTYKDKEGTKNTIGTSTGDMTHPEVQLYERYSTGKITRLEALKTAVNGFVESVHEKAVGEDGKIGTSDDINHRVAVVGFATGGASNQSDYPKYENTEVFVGATQYPYNTTASAHYEEALQVMNTAEGYNNVLASKNALAGRGATYPNFGLEMAKGILDANPVKIGETRNRVVILFTDGVPGWSGYDGDVAEKAVTEANKLKNANVTVYSVGIFDGADATSPGNAQGTGTQKANRFMQRVSNNNGTPQNPSYYLSAADADTLNSIFQQISDQIQTGGSSATLNSEAVIKDIIAPSFELPKNAKVEDISLKTYAYGEGGSWTENADSMGAQATIDGATVSVTGFNFSDNWCGTVTGANGNKTYRGNKLVISFDVVPKAGFLGGNGVPTNSLAAVYQNQNEADNGNWLLKFQDEPTVDVPIKDITVLAPEKNVYLLQDVSASELKSGIANVGNVGLNLSADNYGLKDWQKAYVDITVEVKDANGNAVSTDGLQKLADDTTYQIYVKVSPNKKGTVEGKSGNGSGKINVFKPELTFKDGEAYYGDTVTTDFTDNNVGEVWKHGTTVSTDTGVTIIGNKPELKMEYAPDKTKLADGKYTKQDLPVKATVKIGETDVTNKTTFVHQACSSECGWTAPDSTKPGDPAFLMHIKTCKLKITKTGGANGEPYVFTVMKDGTKYSEVTIVGNASVTISELPVGTYTIEEDTGWSWRYESRIEGPATLNSTSPEGMLTCTNTKKNDKWLNEFSAVVKNIFVKRQTTN